MKLPLYQVDAFTNELFKGNPAAVMPLQYWLPDGLMQQLAMENNLAETVFFVPLPANNAAGAHFHIRWFTPAVEIDLCGHATLATAFVLHTEMGFNEQEIIFSTEKAGLLKVTIAPDGWYLLDFPSRPTDACDAPPSLLEALGIENAVEVRKGRDYFVMLQNEEQILAVHPDFSKLKMQDGMGVIITAPGNKADAVSRCFFPKAGIDEDPVTGSAHSNIVPYWSEKLNKPNVECLQLSARGGLLRCELRGDRVIMGGQAVLYMKGEVSI